MLVPWTRRESAVRSSGGPGSGTSVPATTAELTRLAATLPDKRARPGRWVAHLLPRRSRHLRRPEQTRRGFRIRTIWAAPQPRAARPLWFESGGRGGVSDLAAASSPPRKRRRVDVKAALGQDAKCRPLRPHAGDARWKRRLKDTLASRPRVCLASHPRGLEMCLAQADSTPMARPLGLGIAAVDRRHTVASRREP